MKQSRICKAAPIVKAVNLSVFKRKNSYNIIIISVEYSYI